MNRYERHLQDSRVLSDEQLPAVNVGTLYALRGSYGLFLNASGHDVDDRRAVYFADDESAAEFAEYLRTKKFLPSRVVPLRNQPSSGRVEAPSKAQAPMAISDSHALYGSPETKLDKVAKQFKSDGKKAAKRSTCRKLVTVSKKGIVKLLADEDMPAGKRKQLVQVLDSEVGELLVGAMLGTFLPLVPKFADKQFVHDLAEEFRVEALSRGIDSLVGYAEALVPELAKVLDEAEG